MADDHPPRPNPEANPPSADPSSLKGLTMALGIEPADPAYDPLLGRDIGGVKIIRLIAEGGMGRVYEGLQELPKRQVAVKVMRPGFVSRQASQRFGMELEILGRLRHPYIAQIYSAGMCDVVGSQVPFFVMEYIPHALSITRYAKDKMLGTDARLALFQKVCEAVAHGHEQGIVHRDLKPSNILVEATGNPKIIDFGIARTVGDSPEKMTALTELGQLIGTLQYMSPEQIAADPTAIDLRTDVYALGVILYELLTGTRPYEISNKQIFEAARIVREKKPVSPLKFNRTLRPDVVKITGTCLQKDRAHRFANASELGFALGNYLAGQKVVGVSRRAFATDRRTTLALLAAGILLAGGAAYGYLAEHFSRLVDWNGEGRPISRPAETSTGAEAILAQPPLVNSIGIKLKLIPPGTFRMGDDNGGAEEKPAHQVTLTKPFYLGVHEVTNAEWKRVMGSVPSKWKDDNRPVEQVSWEDGMEFCQKLSALPEEQKAGRVYRLPTEAEWEYACRAGTTTAYSYGDNPNALNDFGWFRATSNSETHAAASRKPNPWGLFDMHGNAWEWCSDGYGKYAEVPVTDPRSPARPERVVRGGGFWETRGGCRSTVRLPLPQASRQDNLGFRVALSLAGSRELEAGK